MSDLVIITHLGIPCDPPTVNGVTFEPFEDGLWAASVTEEQAQDFERVGTFTRFGGKPRDLTGTLAGLTAALAEPLADAADADAAKIEADAAAAANPEDADLASKAALADEAASKAGGAKVTGNKGRK